MEDSNVQQMSSATIIGNVSEFNPELNSWVIFKKKLLQFFIANNIEDNVRKRAILLSALHETVYKLLIDICAPQEPENRQFTDIISYLDAQYQPHNTVFPLRYAFYNSYKDVNENIEGWAERVKRLAENCEFGSAFEIFVRDRFIMGLDDAAIMEKLFLENNNLNFEKAVELAKSIDLNKCNPEVVSTLTQESEENGKEEEPEFEPVYIRNLTQNRTYQRKYVVMQKKNNYWYRPMRNESGRNKQQPFVLEGYIYHTQRLEDNGKRYLVCKLGRRGTCKGKGFLLPSGEFFLTTNHNHKPNTSAVAIKNFKKALRNAVIESNDKPKLVYDKVVSLYPEMVGIVTFFSVERSMRRWRAEHMKNQTNIAQEFYSVLVKPEPLEPEYEIE